MNRLRLASALAGLALLVGATAGCSSDDAPDATGSGEGGSIVFVHTQPAGDGFVTDDAIAGTKEAGEKFGLESNSIYVEDPANYETTLRNVASSGAKVIVTQFPAITDATIATATEHSDITFVHLYADPVEPALPNLHTVSYDLYQTMYLSGVAAATLSETGVVGWVGGDTAPMTAADFNAFAAGAESVDPSIDVIPGLVGNYSDSAKAQEVANQLYSAGADVLQADAGGADTGTIAAAAQEPGRLVIGGSPSAFEAAPGQAVAVVGIRFQPSVVARVAAALADGATGGHANAAIGDELNISFSDVPEDPALAERFEAAQAAVSTAVEAIQSGTVEVPFSTTMP